MATGDRVDPYRGYNFIVEVDNTTGAVAGFREVTGLSFTTDPVEYREGNDIPRHVRKLYGMPKYANLVFKRGMTRNAELFAWYLNVVNGEEDRRGGAVIMRDDQQVDVMRWEWEQGWLCKWEGPSFNATTNEVGLETIEIAVEVVKLVAV